MKYRYILLLVFVGIWAILSIFVIPNGYDVARAAKVRDQVEAILVKAGCLVNVDESTAMPGGIEVMATEVRWGIAVVIGNPKPDAKTILNIISNHRYEIDGDSLEIRFRDEHNVETSRVRISD